MNKDRKRVQTENQKSNSAPKQQEDEQISKNIQKRRKTDQNVTDSTSRLKKSQTVSVIKLDQPQKENDSNENNNLRENDKSNTQQDQNVEKDQLPESLNNQKMISASVSFDGTMSLYNLCERAPATLKPTIEQMLERASLVDQKEEKKLQEQIKQKDKALQTFLKECFLYFIEVSGFDKQDSESLNMVYEFLHIGKLDKKSKSVENSKQLTVAQTEKLSKGMNYSNCVLYLSQNANLATQIMSGNQQKKGIMHQHFKNFKRFCKLIISTLVDAYPKKRAGELMSKLVEGVILLASQQMRVLRFNFTFIGMQLFKHLMAQINSLQQLKDQFTRQPSSEAKIQRERVDLVDKALKFAQQSAQQLACELFESRLSDCTIQVRRLVMEQILDLDKQEILTACGVFSADQKSITFMQPILSQCCKETECGKSALTTLHYMLSILTQNPQTSKACEKFFFLNKASLLNRVLPSPENQNEPAQIVKMIQILSLFHKNLKSDTITAIVNNVHSNFQAVREEAANFMLTVCGDFDNLNSLMPLQKCTVAASGGAESVEGFKANFYEEPQKSKRQLLKLVELTCKHMISRADYLKMIKDIGGQNVTITENTSQNQNQHYFQIALQLSPLDTNQNSPALAEQQAMLLIHVFGNLTSIVFDVQAIKDLFMRQENPRNNNIDSQMKLVLANMLCYSIYYQKNASEITSIKIKALQANVDENKGANQAGANLNQVFDKYFQVSQGVLSSLSDINEMVQSNRDDPSIIQPLIKLLITMSNANLQVEEQSSCKDMLQLLESIFCRYQAQGSHKEEQLLRLCVQGIARMSQFYEPAILRLQSLINEYAIQIDQYATQTNQLDVALVSKLNLLIEDGFAIYSENVDKNNSSAVHDNDQKFDGVMISKNMMTKISNQFNQFIVPNHDLPSIENLRIILQFTYLLCKNLSSQNPSDNNDDTAFEIMVQNQIQAIVQNCLSFHSYLQQKNTDESKQLHLPLLQLVSLLLITPSCRQHLDLVFNDGKPNLQMQNSPSKQQDERLHINHYFQQIVSNMTKPMYYTMHVQNTIFGCLVKVLEENPVMIKTPAGADFFLEFVCANSQSHGVQNADKMIKKMLVSLKQRDSIQPSQQQQDEKRSVFYVLIARLMIKLAEVKQERALQILKMTLTDFDQKESLSVGVQAGVLLVTKFIKMVHQAILLVVNANHSTKSPLVGLSKVQNERAYSSMIEELLKYALRQDQDQILLMALPHMMNSGFISLKIQKQIAQKIEKLSQDYQDENQESKILTLCSQAINEKVFGSNNQNQKAATAPVAPLFVNQPGDQKPKELSEMNLNENENQEQQPAFQVGDESDSDIQIDTFPGGAQRLQKQLKRQDEKKSQESKIAKANEMANKHSREVIQEDELRASLLDEKNAPAEGIPLKRK